MTYTKKYNVEGKIIKKDDIRILINSLLEKLKDTDNITLKIKASFYDDLMIESEEISILEDINFERNKLKKISFKLYSDLMKNYIAFDVSNYCSNNEISVESQDKNLFESLCYTIEERLKQMKNQNKIYRIYQENIYCSISMCLILIVNSILMLSLKMLFKINISLAILMIILLIYTVFEFIYILKFVGKYYPGIQFDFGSESINSPQKPKFILLRVISFLSSEILIPFILQLLQR